MKAYEIIEQYGFIKHAFGDRRRGFCAVGAIVDAYEDGAYSPLISENLRKLQQHVGAADWWNDAPERTKEEVVKVLKELDI